MIFINDSGTEVKINEGTVVREAEVQAEICQEEESPSFNRNKQTSVQVDDLPEHLAEQYYRSTPELNNREKCRVNYLQVEYHDTFSKHDLDLGWLTSVTHKNDTKDNPHVKHMIRKTPLRFQNKKKKISRLHQEHSSITPSEGGHRYGQGCLRIPLYLSTCRLCTDRTQLMYTVYTFFVFHMCLRKVHDSTIFDIVNWSIQLYRLCYFWGFFSSFIPPNTASLPLRLNLFHCIWTLSLTELFITASTAEVYSICMLLILIISEHNFGRGDVILI